jgi:hypothetical protein
MKEDDPLAWVEKAEEDWITANTMMKRHKVFTGGGLLPFSTMRRKIYKSHHYPQRINLPQDT